MPRPHYPVLFLLGSCGELTVCHFVYPLILYLIKQDRLKKKIKVLKEESEKEPRQKELEKILMKEIKLNDNAKASKTQAKADIIFGSIPVVIVGLVIYNSRWISEQLNNLHIGDFKLLSILTTP